MWHTIRAEEAASRLGTDLNSGLSVHDAGERLVSLGRNVIGVKKRRTAARMLLSQFTDFMILVLIGAAVVSGIVGDAVDTAAIVTIVILNAVIGFVQEYRAERSLEALKEMSEPWSAVIRGGTRTEIPVSEVVPGDLVLLEAGRTVPADLRITESAMLKLDEAALTGESLPVDKTAAPLADPDAPIGDRFNMAFKGTSVSFGRGMGIAVATGMQTELGRIAALLAQEKEDKTPLQKRLADFGRKLSIGALAICAFIFVVGLLQGEPPMLMFLTAVSLAVAAIPEALPAVVTVSLAMGAAKMVRKNVLVRRLSAVDPGPESPAQIMPGSPSVNSRGQRLTRPVAGSSRWDITPPRIQGRHGQSHKMTCLGLAAPLRLHDDRPPGGPQAIDRLCGFGIEDPYGVEVGGGDLLEVVDVGHRDAVHHEQRRLVGVDAPLLLDPHPRWPSGGVHSGGEARRPQAHHVPRGAHRHPGDLLLGDHGPGARGRRDGRGGA